MSENGDLWKDADFSECIGPIGSMTDELSLDLPVTGALSMDRLVDVCTCEHPHSADCIISERNRLIFVEFKKWSPDGPDKNKMLDRYLKSEVNNKASDSFNIYIRCLRGIEGFSGKKPEFWLVTDCPRQQIEGLMGLKSGKCMSSPYFLGKYGKQDKFGNTLFYDRVQAVHEDQFVRWFTEHSGEIRVPIE